MFVEETPAFFLGGNYFCIQMGKLREVRLPMWLPLLMFSWDRDAMLSISIQKQWKRPPFSKLCLAHGWTAGQAGAQRQTRQTKRGYSQSVSHVVPKLPGRGCQGQWQRSLDEEQEPERSEEETPQACSKS